MPSQKNINIVDITTEKFQKANGVYFTNYSGLTVPKITSLRKEFSKNSVDYQVIKNTLVKIASKNAGLENKFDDILNGQVGIAPGPDGLHGGLLVVSASITSSGWDTAIYAPNGAVSASGIESYGPISASSYVTSSGFFTPTGVTSSIHAVTASHALNGGGGGSGTITALNNQTANRLVTIGSTTTELDGEANLTYDGTTFTVNDDMNVSKVISQTVHTLAQNDATPSVAAGNIFITNNTSNTNITGLDDGVAGQEVTIIIQDTNTNFYDGTNFNIFRSLNWTTPNVNDVAKFLCVDGTKWVMTSRMDNS